MVHPNRRTPLTGYFLERIAASGPINYAEYMEACLYHPQHGYYTSRVPKTGRRDYFTSPEVGPIFGRLLGWQLREMWERMGCPAPFEVIECGAGNGQLARDVLTWVSERAPEFLAALRYTVTEISETQREQAAAQLEEFGGRVAVVAELPVRPVAGCIFSNELLDALPVHRVVMRGQGLQEIRIGVRSGANGMELAEVEDEASTPDLQRYLERYGAPLEEGQVAEIGLAALDWLQQVAASLAQGFLLTIDYGYRARELYGPGHRRGTLLAYRDHRSNEDWLGWPGLQDLTAHVNFTALEDRGRDLGLNSLGLVSQTRFLLGIARASGFLQELEGGVSGRKPLAVLEPFKQLVHPAGMGETFKVMVQTTGMEAVKLSGLEPF